MKILEIIPSRENCVEAGWYAYDYLLAAPVDKALVDLLRPLGSMTYLGMLRRPFFKIDTAEYSIKGIEGNDFFRIAVDDQRRECLDRINAFLEAADWPAAGR
ncbi:MAG: hypothetical protein IJL53_11825 [Firmicutes bacterium]|nr:hypothetical protein [Bacillota bacterium]